MKYDVDYAVGYEDGTWKKYNVRVDIPDPGWSGWCGWLEQMEHAAGEALLEQQEPDPHEVFAVVLDYKPVKKR